MTDRLLRAASMHQNVIPPQLGGGQVFKAPRTLPAGRVHAAWPSDPQALCGAPIRYSFDPYLGPAAIGDWCKECAALAEAAQPTP